MADAFLVEHITEKAKEVEKSIYLKHGKHWTVSL